MKLIKQIWNEQPLGLILFVAIFLRIISAIFSKGYAMMDDNFLVVEQAQQWVNHYDDNKWLPAYGASTPSGHSLFYVGIHYLLFKLLEFIGIIDSQIKMYFVRFLHAAFSMITVVLGYRITKHYSNIKSARTVGILLAAMWLYPFLSVRNLVEITCLPLFLYGLWITIKNIEKTEVLKLFFFAGLISGISASIRFQAALLCVGLFFAIFLKKEYKKSIYYALGASISFILIQGVADLIVWKRPFAEFGEYVQYNLDNKYNYFVGKWYNYLILISGLLIPPISFFLLFGWLKTWKKLALIFIPSALFLVFHMYFPNRQERFILPILPLITISGVIGWNEFVEKSKFWNKNYKLLKASWIFFWVINIIVLIPITTTYTKRSNVEAMSYLKDKPYIQLIVDDKNHESATLMPRFYLQNWKSIYYIPTETTYVNLKNFVDYEFRKNNIKSPQYVLFLEFDNLQSRIDSIKLIFPKMTLDTIVEPGFIDKVMHKLNKRNKNQSIIIYKTNENS